MKTAKDFLLTVVKGKIKLVPYTKNKSNHFFKTKVKPK